MSGVEPTSAGGGRRRGLRMFIAGAALTVLVVALVAGYLFWRSGRGTAAVVFANGATVPDNSTGLAPQERQQYYHLTEGGEIWPVAALLALETTDPAAPGEYVPFLGSKDRPGVPERFGMLPDPVSEYNPYGLPVGVTVAQHGKIQLMGLNCTACHVGELQYQGKRFRVDGGPNMAFVNAFVKAIADETGATLRNPERTARFLHRLSDARRQLVPLKHYPAVEHEYGTNDGTDVDDPFGGDDVGSWLRSLVSRLWHDDAILESRKDSLRNMGYLTGSFLISPGDGFGRADAFGVGRNALFGGVDLGKVFPKGTNSAPSDAPVSFPHIWGMQYTSWLQWGANTNSVMERNVGQSLGVGAAYDPKTFISTVRIDNLAALEDLSYKIEPPKWPEEIFGMIDRDRAARGKVLFDRTCALCHETYPKTKEGLEEYQLFPLNVVGTDPATALNFERLVMPPPSVADAHGADPSARPFGSAAFTIVGNVLQKYYADLKIPDDVRKRWEHRELRPDQEFRSTMRQSAEYPDARGLKVYRAKTLRGIWATAPYLHNGSVPTIYDLLLPASERPVRFTAGTREFDPTKLGLAPNGPTPPGMEPTVVDTTLPGNWNGGHEWWFYPSLSNDDRYAIIEFLKTFWLPNAGDYTFTAPAELPKEVRAPYPLEHEPAWVPVRP